MLRRFKLLQKQLVLVAIVLLAELVLIGTLLYVLDQEEREANRAERVFAVTVQANLLLKEFHESISSLMMYGLTMNADYGHRLVTQSQGIPAKIDALEKSSAEFPEDREAMQQIVTAARTWSSLLEQATKIVTKRSEPGMTIVVARFLSHDVRPHMMELTETVANFVEHHRAVEGTEKEALNRSRSLLRWILIGGGLMQVALAMVSFVFFSRNITGRLTILRDNAFRLASGMPLRPLMGGVDEISQLDKVFHEMAAALSAAAEKERAIVDGMPVGFIILDRTGAIQLVNPRSLAMLKASTEDLIGKPLTNFLLSSDDQKLSFATVKESALGRVSEFQFLRTDGGSFPAELYINSIKDADQELFICNLLDVSERHEVERMKREFVSIVSHDLKTPLTSIKSTLYLLTLGTLGTLNERGTKIIRGTQQEAERLVRLVTDLLDMARIEAGRMDLDCARVELRSIIERAVNAVGVQAEERKIKLQVHDVPLVVFGDSDRLVQVVVNFLSNAIKYAPPTSTVKIDCSRADKMVTVRVTDQGPGISKTAHAKIFERFEQVSSQDRTTGGGIGLGLAISKLIVEAHQGTIGVDSEVGKGSSFWFKIPDV